MASTTLFAPQIRAAQPAFIYNGTSDSPVKIYFTLSAYNSIANVGAVKYQITNPHQASTWGTNVIQSGEVSADEITLDSNTGEYYFSISTFEKALTVNQFYQIQIWLREKSDSDTKSVIYSEASQVSLIRPIPPFNEEFDWPSDDTVTNPEDLQTFSGTLKRNGTGPSADMLGTYSIIVSTSNTEVYKKTNIINSLGARFSTKLDYAFRENTEYTFTFDYETAHGYKPASAIKKIITTSSVTKGASPWPLYTPPSSNKVESTQKGRATEELSLLKFFFNNDESKADNENGSIHLSFNLISGERAIGKGYTIICQRSADEDNFSAWTTIAEIALNRNINGSEKFDIEDFYVDQGVVYLYRFLLKNPTGQYIYYTDGDYFYQAELEDIFLSNKDRQLAIRFNPQVSNFKYVVQESITNTLGGKYPIIRRNADTKYRQFSISGTLYFEGDALFNESVSYDSYGNSMNSWFDEPVSSFFLTTDEAYSAYKQFFASRSTDLKVEESKVKLYENKFRNAAINFLTDGKPKLFRSATEGNILVYLSNISFTPNQKLGGAIYNFSATATEFAECTYNNLKKYGLFHDFKQYQYVLEANSAKYSTTADNKIVVMPYVDPSKVRAIGSKQYLVLKAKVATNDKS